MFSRSIKKKRERKTKKQSNSMIKTLVNRISTLNTFSENAYVRSALHHDLSMSKIHLYICDAASCRSSKADTTSICNKYLCYDGIISIWLEQNELVCWTFPYTYIFYPTNPLIENPQAVLTEFIWEKCLTSEREKERDFGATIRFSTSS